MTIKKVIATLLTLSLVLTLCCSCTESVNVKEDSKDKLNIVTTIFPAYDFAREIAGEYGDIHMLIKPGSEVHSYEPTPNDIQLINNCDVFVYVGGDSDSWIDGVLDTVNNDNIKIIKMMDYADNLEEEYSKGMQVKGAENHDDSQGDDVEYRHVYDEHVWTSPVNAIKIVKAMTDAFVSIDHTNSDVYINNSEKYISELTQLDNAFRKTVESAKRKTLVFGDRFPLLHFTKEYGLDYYAAYPGCAAESEPSVKTVAFLIEKVKAENIPVVFHIEFSNEKMTDTICEETGAEKMRFSSCHNVTAEEFEQGITYLDLMQNNLNALKKALN